MKNILYVILGVVISTTGYANNWQQLDLNLQSEAPMMNSTQVANSALVKTPTAPFNSIQRLNLSIFTEYSQYKTDLKSGDSANLRGFSIGVSTPPMQTGWYGKFEALNDNKLDANYYSLSVGLQKNLLNYKNFYLIGSAGLGYSWMKSSLLSNDVNFISLPVGLELGYLIKPNWSIYGGVGYQWLWESVSNDSYFGNTGGGNGKTLCNDGTWSNSTGQGTCSHHDGVAQNPSSPNNNMVKDVVGDNNGTLYKFGLRYNF